MKAFKLFLTLFFPSMALAQAYNCDGVWSNQPCKSGTPLATLKFTPAVPKSSDEIQAAQKKSKKQTLVHDLGMKASDADRKFKIHFELGPVIDFCNLPETEVIDCQSKVDELGDRIDKKVNEKETLEVSKKANKLQEEKNKIDAENSGASTTIIRDPVYIIVETPTPVYGIPPRRTPYARVSTPVYDSPFSDQIAADKKGQHDFSPEFGKQKKHSRH